MKSKYPASYVPVMWYVRSKVACKQLNYLPVCSLLCSPKTGMIQILRAVHFSPFKWLLVRQKLGCTVFSYT